MKLIDILDKDRDNILTSLAEAGNAEKAVRVLENETDKLLLRYNEQCGSEQVREMAAYMMQSLRLSLPLIDSAGRAKVWEHEAGSEAGAGGSSQSGTGSRSGKSGKGGKSSKGGKDSSGGLGVPGALLIILAAVLCVYGMIPLILAGLESPDAVTHKELVIRLIASAAGLAAAFAAGALLRRPAVKAKKEQHVEIKVDADKLYRHYRTAVLSVDQSLDEISAREQWDKREQAGMIDGHQPSSSEIDLFSDLLAASYSGDPEYALEKIDAIKYYLHKQQIEVVDYSTANSKYFDLMPGTRAGTIRPALVADGTLLRKGLASTGK